MRARVIGMALLAAAIVGCGGDDSEEPSRPETRNPPTTREGPTKAEFIREADKICMKFRKRGEDLDRQAEQAGMDNEKLADLMVEYADAGDEVLDGFRRLGTPTTGSTAALREYQRISREQIVLLGRVADLLRDGETTQANTILDSGQETGARLRGIAQGYGFKVCGSGG